MTIVIRKTEKKIQTAGKCYVELEYPSIANGHCKTGSMPGEKNVNISGDEEKERKERERREKGKIGEGQRKKRQECGREGGKGRRRKGKGRKRTEREEMNGKGGGLQLGFAHW